MSYTNQLGSVYLNNTAGAVTPGGDPTVGALTPFSIKPDWTPVAVEPDSAFASSGPLSAGARLAYSAYPLTVKETIPIGVEGTSHNNAQRLLGLLRAALRRPGKRGPIVWRVRPVGALFDAYTEVYGGTVVGRGAEIGPGVRLDGAVIFDGAKIDAGAVVERSIIGYGARIGPRALIRDGVIGDGADIGARCELLRGARVWPGVFIPDCGIRYSSDV